MAVAQRVMDTAGEKIRFPERVQAAEKTCRGADPAGIALFQTAPGDEIRLPEEIKQMVPADFIRKSSAGVELIDQVIPPLSAGFPEQTRFDLPGNG